ncbi:MAG: heat-inducible transcriptional repressor HrcA [Acidimicrobiia bacterium]|nr:heat-inducible transcriptional repressor HrcA [Acidimicrobiia bacterium]
MDDRHADGRDDRRDEVLRALVEEHIRTGEPVSSKMVLDTTGLPVSGATIRNELAALEREGFAVQPHTSAGRVPTARAYRYYVDHLSPAKLQTPAQRRISDFFASMHVELGRLLKATTELLTDLTQYPSIAIGPGTTGEVVKAAHLVQTGAKTALLVVVTASGRVAQELCRLPEAMTTKELERAEEMLVRSIVGKEIGGSTDFGLRHADAPSPVRSALGVVEEALRDASARTADVYVGGTRQMATVWDNLSTVQRVLEVLEREATILSLLGGAEGTSIRIGDELPTDDVDLAVVSTGYEIATGEGRVGVIGPMRMDYRKVISAVEGVSRELGDRMAE